LSLATSLRCLHHFFHDPELLKLTVAKSYTSAIGFNSIKPTELREHMKRQSL
jgi:hypothetical protein